MFVHCTTSCGSVGQQAVGCTKNPTSCWSVQKIEVIYRVIEPQEFIYRSVEPADLTTSISRFQS